MSALRLSGQSDVVGQIFLTLKVGLTGFQSTAAVTFNQLSDSCIQRLGGGLWRKQT